MLLREKHFRTDNTAKKKKKMNLHNIFIIHKIMLGFLKYCYNRAVHF